MSADLEQGAPSELNALRVSPTHQPTATEQTLTRTLKVAQTEITFNPLYRLAIGSVRL